VLKGKQDDHTFIQQNVNDFMKTFTEISEVIEQEESSVMAIDKTHACHATIVSAVALDQRAMLIVSLDPSGKNLLCKPGGTDGVGVSACVCKMDSSCIIGSIQQRKSFT